MEKKQIKQEVFELYDKYAHNLIDRREFMNRLSTYAVGGVTVASIMSFILPDYKTTQLVAADDPRIISSYVTYASPKGAGTMKGLLVMPAAATGKLAGVIVVHENRGLNPYIEDVARRTALDGFIAFAPDALTPFGGYPGTDDEGRQMQSKRNREEMLQDFIAAFDLIKAHEKCNGKVGVVGFCFGGSIANDMAVRLPELKASVPFYGGQPKGEEVSKINAPLLIHYASLDERVNSGWSDYEKALKSNKKTYQTHFYEGVNHGFHNNTTPRYDETAATLAWSRTISFFKEQLV